MGPSLWSMVARPGHAQPHERGDRIAGPEHVFPTAPRAAHTGASRDLLNDREDLGRQLDVFAVELAARDGSCASLVSLEDPRLEPRAALLRRHVEHEPPSARELADEHVRNLVVGPHLGDRELDLSDVQRWRPLALELHVLDPRPHHPEHRGPPACSETTRDRPLNPEREVHARRVAAKRGI